MQAEFARLIADADARERFECDPHAESATLEGIAPLAIRRYAEGVLSKRYREVRALLPASARAASFRNTFSRYAARTPIGGFDRHRADAIAFARELGTPIARAERTALQASIGGRRFFAITVTGHRIYWWLRISARSRLSSGSCGTTIR